MAADVLETIELRGVRPEVVEERRDAGTVVGSLGDNADEAGKVRAAPAVRRLARDKGVDLHDVTGTGIGGRVTLADVEAAANSPAAGTS